MDTIISLVHKLSNISITVLILIVLPFLIVSTQLIIFTRKIYINVFNKCIVKLNH